MEQLKNDLLSVLERHGYKGDYRIKVNDKRIKDGFFSENRNIYDSSEYWFEDVWVNKTKWLFNDYEIREDFELQEVDFIDSLIWNSIEDLDEIEEILQKTLADIKTEYPQLYSKIIDEIKAKDYYDLESYLDVIFGINYPEETFNEIEKLSYWIVYYQPKYWDEDIAWKVGLFPFQFENEWYLALGGCGMDLSPLLDAYQALTVGSVPSDSTFLREPSYAKYVVGEKIFNEVMEAIKLDKPIITIYC